MVTGKLPMPPCYCTGSFLHGYYLGTVVLMIGASLIGSSGILDWGGGSNNCATRPTTGIFALCPTIFAPRPLPYNFRVILILTPY
jgi:hypothetical protein